MELERDENGFTKKDHEKAKAFYFSSGLLFMSLIVGFAWVFALEPLFRFFFG